MQKEYYTYIFQIISFSHILNMNVHYRKTMLYKIIIIKVNVKIKSQ